MENLIKLLEERYSLNTHPDVATTVAQSLIQLSSGIYTEEERYIFELLQNAVDAHTANAECLDIKIVCKDNHFVFMHNGGPFSERDVKGLCDIGNGNKAADAKKIGYKGIGFKSVFMRSTCVTVETGGYCFKFDKSHWDGYWDNNWDEKFGTKENDKHYLMPWQIIPLETEPPINIEKSGYNVITYIRLDKNSRISDKIVKLLDNSQFLLFLKTANIRISYEYNGTTLSIEKETDDDGKVNLSSNGQTQSRWLLYTNEEVSVPVELTGEINADTNTPEKLKGAKTFDLSFAIALGNDGKLRKVDRSEAVIYTYLPTSYKFGAEGFPFLVNANFITDAGRQQLHKDSVWNRLIFSKIPSEFLKWIAQISSSYSNYCEILPKKSYGNENIFEQVYASEMQKTIDSIKFIPRQDKPEIKLLAKEAVMDRMNITKSISKEVLINHINTTYNLNLRESNFITTIWREYRILEDYGVFIFGKNRIKALLEDNSVFNKITIEQDIALMEFLYNYQNKNKDESYEFNSILSKTKFLLDEDKNLKCPSELFFSTNYKKENTLAADVSLIHNDINSAVREPGLRNWLSELGVQTLSNLSFVKYLYEHGDYITTENAINIGRFIFEISQKEDLFGTVSQYHLHKIKFLTTKGNLMSAGELFLSAKYKPDFNIEPIFDEDIFVSDKYCENCSADEYAEWKVFLLKMGVSQDIYLGTDSTIFFGDKYNSRYDNEFFETVKKASERYCWVSYNGFCVDRGDYRFDASEVYFDYISFFDKCDNYKFSNLVFSRLIVNYVPKDIDLKVTNINGYTGCIRRSMEPYYLTNMGCEVNLFKWVLENCAIIPTNKKKCYKAKDVFSNAIPQIKEIAGDYLPVLDVDTPISNEWQKFLGLKDHLTFENYLSLLKEFSDDIENVETNKSRISLVYQKLVETDCLDSQESESRLEEWSKTGMLLCRDNTFRTPRDLCYITLSGFASDNLVYIGSPANREKVIKLLGLMGVKIITEDSIHPDFEGSEKEATELKNILTYNISPLALISAGKTATETKYNEAKVKIQSRLNESCFYHCNTIKLTYGNHNDVIERQTFAMGNEFYYIGDLRPANIEPLLTPLCKYLGIIGRERELFVMMIEKFDGIRQNLNDKGYNVELLEEYNEPVGSGTFIPTYIDSRPEIQKDRDRITGFQGEIIVYEKLKSYGYNPKCPTISEEDFSGSTKISMDGKTYYCKDNYDKYDMHFIAHNGVKVFVEVKATTFNKGALENMPISWRELSMIENCRSNENEKYVIVRVFGIGQSEQDIYCFDGQILNNKTFETK